MVGKQSHFTIYNLEGTLGGMNLYILEKFTSRYFLGGVRLNLEHTKKLAIFGQITSFSFDMQMN